MPSKRKSESSQSPKESEPGSRKKSPKRTSDAGSKSPIEPTSGTKRKAEPDSHLRPFQRRRLLEAGLKDRTNKPAPSPKEKEEKGDGSSAGSKTPQKKAGASGKKEKNDVKEGGSAKSTPQSAKKGKALPVKSPASANKKGKALQVKSPASASKEDQGGDDCKACHGRHVAHTCAKRTTPQSASKGKKGQHVGASVESKSPASAKRASSGKDENANKVGESKTPKGAKTPQSAKKGGSARKQGAAAAKSSSSSKKGKAAESKPAEKLATPPPSPPPSVAPTSELGKNAASVLEDLKERKLQKQLLEEEQEEARKENERQEENSAALQREVKSFEERMEQLEEEVGFGQGTARDEKFESDAKWIAKYNERRATRSEEVAEDGGKDGFMTEFMPAYNFLCLHLRKIGVDTKHVVGMGVNDDIAHLLDQSELGWGKMTGSKEKKLESLAEEYKESHPEYAQQPPLEQPPLEQPPLEQPPLEQP
eukprot:CAMPEP_0181312848 /NCGR_PEP_ID=MMETSP1101-20121128/13923_1 /TAXON_ID=46948 /ORGANISM="Rhodomonas abbreviata, Strain Caron Lab Isolate" /LENGTH=479 /DNA_ID=CAMNT_0023419741 /DNA_START=141 /DNA_END=1576 /DNA_ORIENTATION=+